jgi:hypothetical protein
MYSHIFVDTKNLVQRIVCPAARDKNVSRVFQKEFFKIHLVTLYEDDAFSLF